MFVPLKVTTEYSLLKSLIKVQSLISFLKYNNISAAAIVDDNLYGVLDFYYACKKNDIKPIIGLEIKLNDLVVYLYAKNYDGYKNLLKIHTIKENGVISLDDLNKYSNDIIIILPFKSKEIFDLLSKCFLVFMGYSNRHEKNNCLMITDNSVFVQDLRVLKNSDIKYMKYLDLLRGDEERDYSDNCYQEYDFIDNVKINQFVSLFNIEIPMKNRFIPKYKEDVDSYLFLSNLANKGLNKRLNGLVLDEYRDRLNYELSVIKKMGFQDYFLIVYDYVLYAKKNNILVGPGRGSAAGSLVSYAIGITDIDPLKYNLLFERFLNPNRITMPDIDIDFDAQKRDDVIQYVKSKYGINNVALGLTFNTFKSKLVIREVGKILRVDSNLIDKFVKWIDHNKTLEENFKTIEIQKYLKNYKELRDVYDVASHLEGLKKNVSTHAAGVVISSVSLDEVIPIHMEQGKLITGVTMDFLEDMGLLKMDFLGLKNLTTIANIIKNIEGFNLKDINLEEKEVFSLFASGKTEGIFQFETPLMKSLITKLKPTCFNDLIAGVALGRPGPRDFAMEYILRKEGKKPVVYIHNDLKEILCETYGIILYQEQIMAILNKIAGYSYGEADLIRRAISKKKESVLVEEREKFIKRAVERGYNQSEVNKIYDLIYRFVSYGFNKSHSVAYALVAYQMGYLKTFYPAQFLVELLNNGGLSDRSNQYLTFMKSKGIKFFKPSVNNNYLDYHINQNKLYLPLRIIKNINEDVARKIYENKGEKYSDLFDFCYKNKEFMNESLLRILISAGALDVFGINRCTLDENVLSALNYAELQDDSMMIEKPIMVEKDEYDSEKLRNDEIDSYGFYISNHPTSKYIDSKYMKLWKLEENVFKKVKCVVLILKITNIKTKKNEDMAFINASDETGVADFVVFSNNYDKIKDLKNNDVVEINGEVTKRFDKYNIIINNIRKVG